MADLKNQIDFLAHLFPASHDRLYISPNETGDGFTGKFKNPDGHLTNFGVELEQKEISHYGVSSVPTWYTDSPIGSFILEELNGTAPAPMQFISRCNYVGLQLHHFVSRLCAYHKLPLPEELSVLAPTSSLQFTMLLQYLEEIRNATNTSATILGNQ
ncbi:hypothetical protein AAVH_38467 [Aphelenchoides avenae]|nr:hypothetical protein AAVH_38467 [Aphelenchus avenae]